MGGLLSDDSQAPSSGPPVQAGRLRRLMHAVTAMDERDFSLPPGGPSRPRTAHAGGERGISGPGARAAPVASSYPCFRRSFTAKLQSRLRA